jgi:threonine dehydrogenase-like Zn-dependent dehydrogenase
MKAVQVVSRGCAQFVDVPVPAVPPRHVLVRARLLSLCGSDIHMLHYAAESAYPFPVGTTGHEMVGVVESVGAAVRDVQVGNRVLALSPGHQAMSEFHLTPVEHIVPLPEGLPLELLLQGQQLGTVIYACQRLPNVIGRNVVVIGQGSAGLWFNYQLRRMGALRVIAVDIEPFRLRLSGQFGATHTIHNGAVDPEEALREITGGSLADIVVEAAGEPSAIDLCARLVRKFGEILFFGLPRGPKICLDFEHLFRKCCVTRSIVGAAEEQDQLSTRIAMDLIASGEADPAALITHRVPFAEVLDAYEMHHRRSDGAVKIVIEMPL